MFGRANVLRAYSKFSFAAGVYKRVVYTRGAGPAVIVIHEMPGLHPGVIRFADRVAEAGMTVYLPVLFGVPGKPVSSGYVLGSLINTLCVRREFNVWSAGRSSPIVDWLRALAKKAHEDCGGRGVGAVGMCITGGFALAMMTEPTVVAPVLSQPAVPVALGSAARAAGIDASAAEILCARTRFEAEDLSMIGLRFKSDKTVPDARFATYAREFGDRFERIELDDSAAAPSNRPPHSVLTMHLREEGPSKAAEQRVIAFLKERTAAPRPFARTGSVDSAVARSPDRDLNRPMVSARARIAIIGCGHVGVTCAHALLHSRLCREIVLIDENHDRARGEALDLRQAMPFDTPIKIYAGDYKDAATSQIVIMTAGGTGKFSGSRLDLLADNVGIVRSCVGKLMAESFAGALLIATNPVDILTFVAQRESGLPVGKVIGSGTLIDTERLRALLGEKLHVDARSVHAQVIGEHGDSSVIAWSAAEVGGVPLALYPGADALPSREELLASVRRAGPEVVALKGNTCFAIAACVIRICGAILRDERSVLVVSTLMTGQYGLREVCIGTPCVIGENGVESVLELRLDPAEQKAVEASAAVLQNAYAQLGAA